MSEAESVRRACSRCGVLAEPGVEHPPGWSWAPSARGIEWTCLECTRANVRAIEAKLPDEYWE